jgi:hypothetical protein
MDINETNYRIVKAQILFLKNQLQRELKKNHDAIKALEKSQTEIKAEWNKLMDDMEKIGEFELESEYKFLQEIERNCKRCGKLYDKRQSNNELCPACFTSNA